MNDQLKLIYEQRIMDILSEWDENDLIDFIMQHTPKEIMSEWAEQLYEQDMEE